MSRNNTTVVTSTPSTVRSSVLLTPTPERPATQEAAPASTDTDKPEAGKSEENEVAILENQLQLAVEVLTSKSCSEEGLEDATNLLLQLSRANSPTRNTVLKLLLAGARQLGLTVCQHIRYCLCNSDAVLNT